MNPNSITSFISDRSTADLSEIPHADDFTCRDFRRGKITGQKGQKGQKGLKGKNKNSHMGQKMAREIKRREVDRERAINRSKKSQKTTNQYTENQQDNKFIAGRFDDPDWVWVDKDWHWQRALAWRDYPEASSSDSEENTMQQQEQEQEQEQKQQKKKEQRRQEKYRLQKEFQELRQEREQIQQELQRLREKQQRLERKQDYFEDTDDTDNSDWY